MELVYSVLTQFICVSYTDTAKAQNNGAIMIIYYL